jgi:hypothetical protein
VRRHLAALVGVVVLGATAEAQPSPVENLARARAEFDRAKWKRVIAELEPVLYPRALFREEDQLKEAYYLLGAAFFLDNNPDRARHEFTALLFLDPTHSLDSATESPQVYAFFDGLKRELRQRLEEIRKQKEREEEQRRRPSREVLIERTIHPPGSPISNFIPFGYPQFRNGEPGWGTFFLTTQAVTGGASVALFTYQAVTYGIPGKYDASTDASTLRAMQIVQVSTGAAFLALYGWSVIDGFVNQKPRVEEKRSERPIPRETSLAPSILPLWSGAPDSVGAQVVWRF